MVCFGMDNGETTEGKCQVCKREVKIQGDSATGYSYRCVCGHKEQLGKLPKESNRKLTSNIMY